MGVSAIKLHEGFLYIGVLDEVEVAELDIS